MYVREIINFFLKLTEAVVRCNLLNTLTKVASFCAEYDSPLVSLKELIDTDILPIVLKAIADEDRNCNMRVSILIHINGISIKILDVVRRNELHRREIF